MRKIECCYEETNFSKNSFFEKGDFYNSESYITLTFKEGRQIIFKRKNDSVFFQADNGQTMRRVKNES